MTTNRNRTKTTTRRTSKRGRDPRKQTLRQPGSLDHPVRSDFERQVAESLRYYGIPYQYEGKRVRYVVQRDAIYTPDFILPNGIIIEAKGYFGSEDRSKHLQIKEQRPDLDIRFVFQNPNQKLYKGSKTRVRDWCEKHGFRWANKTIPFSWTQEEPKEHDDDGEDA